MTIAEKPNWQLFGEEAPAEAETPAEIPAEAPEESFEELIRGRWKEEFDARVQKILDRRLKSLRRENEELRQGREDRRRQGAAALARLEQEEAAVQAVYPEYRCEEALRDPAFGTLVLRGVDGRTAYEAVHREALLRRAMDYAARRAREETCRAVASGQRVGEGGKRSAAVSRTDPRSLTSAELSAIRQRVLDGEKIRF